MAALVAGGHAGASDQPREPKPREFGTSTYQVSVDFVARDKRGRGIEDLTPAEVEVYEDGVRQEIESLRLVHRSASSPDSGSESTPLPPGPAGPTIVPPEGPELLAIVLDNIAFTHRRDVRDRLREHFADHWREGQQVGVFVVGDRLAVAQPFTGDRTAILEGVDRALGWQVSQTLARQSDIGVMRAVNTRLPGMAALYLRDQDPALAGGGRRDPTSSANQRLLDLAQAGIPGSAELDRDEAGLTTVYSLMAVVNAMSAARGRKAIVFMTEEFRLTPRTELRFPSLVAAANEAQVSIYSIAGAGFDLSSPNARLQDGATTSGASRTVDPIFGTSLGVDGDTFLASARRGLFQVADSTGGAAIEGSNGLALGLAKADDDLGDYYVLSYSPRNEDFDGRFREIRVKVRRSHGELRARRGYLALRTRTWAEPVLAYEAPALSRLEKTPTADQFPVHVQALVFPTGSAGSITAILAELRGGAMGVTVEKKAGLVHQDFSIVAVVRDPSGAVVRKLSQYYPLSGALARIEDIKRNKILFYKETDLPPGRYSVEVVVHDNRARAASVRRMALEVPEAGGQRLQASSLVLVEHAEDAGGENHRSAPLVVKGVQLYPNLDAAAPRIAAGEAEFFLRVWPAAGRESVRASFELLRGDQVVAAHDLGPLPPDESGEVNVLAGVSVSGFPPGPYNVRVTLRDGHDVAARSVDLTIAPDVTRNP